MCSTLTCRSPLPTAEPSAAVGDVTGGADVDVQ
jgi:hypothetical protein